MKVSLIGITGGIGAGKSIVSRILRSQGFRVYDCDTRAKELMIESEELNAGLRSVFGQECVGRERIDRARLAEIIFSDSDKRRILEAMVYEAVRSDVESWVASCRPPVFVEAAIMSRSGLAEMVDEVWVVDAPEDVRIERAMNRDGANELQIRARMEAQENELRSLPAGKVRIIPNDGSSPLLERIAELLASIDTSAQLENSKGNKQ